MSTRLLYVEDDPGHARLGAKRLQRSGYVVELAESAEEALQLLDQKSYDVVLTDLGLPGMSGLELLGKIGKLPQPVPTILVTGNGSEGSAVDAMRSGASDYVVKDVDGGYLDLLTIVVESVLAKEQIVRERRDALDALKASEERFRLLFNNVPIGLYRVSATGEFIDVNPALCGILGVSNAESLKGKNLLHYYVDQDVRDTRSVALKEKSALQEFEARLRNEQGHVFWILENAAPTYGQIGVIESIDGSLQDLTERKRHEEHLAYLAAHDALTELPNRHLLEDRLEQALRAARRGRFLVGVLLIDLDGFKQVNDELGHAAGDEVLVRVGQLMASRLRQSDTIARLGGDEFVAVLSGVRDLPACEKIAHEILDMVRNNAEEADPAHCTASIGIAVFPHDGDDFRLLLRRADQAMYAAKRSGGDRVRVARSLACSADDLGPE